MASQTHDWRSTTTNSYQDALWPRRVLNLPHLHLLLQTNHQRNFHRRLRSLHQMLALRHSLSLT